MGCQGERLRNGTRGVWPWQAGAAVDPAPRKAMPARVRALDRPRGELIFRAFRRMTLPASRSTRGRERAPGGALPGRLGGRLPGLQRGSALAQTQPRRCWGPGGEGGIRGGGIPARDLHRQDERKDPGRGRPLE